MRRRRSLSELFHDPFFVLPVRLLRQGLAVTCLAATLFALPPPANAEKAGELVENCRIGAEAARNPERFLTESTLSDSDIKRAYRCMDFLRGIAQTVWVHRAAKLETLFCPTKEALTPGHAAGILVDWADKNPEGLDSYSVIAAIEAFQDRFPCRR